MLTFQDVTFVGEISGTIYYIHSHIPSCKTMSYMVTIYGYYYDKSVHLLSFPGI